MPKLSCISKNNTAIYVNDDGTRQVFLHKTCIVTVRPDGSVFLNTGGWLTNTTITRMNQVSAEWGLGYSVSRAKGVFSAYLHGFEGTPTIKSRDNQTLLIPPRGQK